MAVLLSTESEKVRHKGRSRQREHSTSRGSSVQASKAESTHQFTGCHLTQHVGDKLQEPKGSGHERSRAQIKDHKLSLSIPCFLPASLVVLLISLLKHPTLISKSLSVTVRCDSNNRAPF